MIIDADAHVEESEPMFECLDEEFYPRRPLAIPLARDTVYAKYNAVWLIDGETYPKLVGKGGTIFRTPTLMEAASLKRESIGAQELTDVRARLKDMDKVGIDIQVVFPSLFLTTTTEDLKLETALVSAYNSFLGDCYTNSKESHPLRRTGADPRYRCFDQGNRTRRKNRRRGGDVAWHGLGQTPRR